MPVARHARTQEGFKGEPPAFPSPLGCALQRELDPKRLKHVGRSRCTDLLTGKERLQFSGKSVVATLQFEALYDAVRRSPDPGRKKIGLGFRLALSSR